MAGSFAGGWRAHTPPPPVAVKVAEAKHDDVKASQATAVAAQAKQVDEVAPKVITVVKRYPVMLPGPGCPVATAEETTTTTTADRRITQEASRQASATIAQEARSSEASFSERTPVAAAQRRLTLGLFGGSDFGGRKFAAGTFQVRILERAGIAVIAVKAAGEPVSAGAGLTWTW